MKAGVVGRVAAYMAGVPAVIHTPHCFTFTRTQNGIIRKAFVTIEKLLGRVTDILVAVSEDEANLATELKIVRQRGCAGIPNGIKPDVDAADRDIASIRRLYGIRPGARVVATASRLVKYKGIFQFLEAARLSRTPDCVFLLAGEGELRPKVERWLLRNKTTQKVRLLNYVENMEDLYAITDVFVLGSRAEGLPYVLLEAMRARCGIVASDVPGNRELIEDGANGCLVSPEPPRVAATIDRLLADGDLCGKLGENAHARVRAKYTLDRQVDALLNVYRSGVIRPPGRGDWDGI
jgi:glycosyltransferase involved in cell wall biosynthesis